MLGEMLQDMRHPPAGTNWLRGAKDRLSYVLLVALFNVFPLPQESGFRRAFRFAGECVDRGDSIVVFPEGSRTPDGQIAPFRSGIGLLAKNLNLPVIPMRIDGLYEFKKSKKWRARPGSVKVKIDRPVQFPPELNALQIARELEQLVRQLT
jgi:long-chain acyl-CoA synthetase